MTTTRARRSGGPEQLKRRCRTDDRRGLEPEPAVEHRGVEGPEVERRWHVAVRERAEVDGISVQPTPDSGTSDEGDAARAMVRSTARVLVRAPAELRVGEHRQAIDVAVGLGVLQER